MMFDWIDYIHTFWQDFYTKIDSYTIVDMNQVMYTLGNKMVDLEHLLIYISTLLTSLFMVLLTYRFIVKMYKISRGLFS